MAEDIGASEFLTHCATCHADPPAEHTPAAANLKQMTPERIYQTLTTGATQSIAATLSDEQKVRIAEFLGGRKFDPTTVERSHSKSYCNHVSGGNNSNSLDLRYSNPVLFTVKHLTELLDQR